MKNSRQKKILEIIRSRNVETQEELMLRLCESGHSVTQATVSRDINALRLVKVPDGAGGYKYERFLCIAWSKYRMLKMSDRNGAGCLRFL